MAYLLKKVILMFFATLCSSIALAGPPITASENPSLDGNFSITWPASIWNSFHPNSNSGYVFLAYRPASSSGSYTTSALRTYTRINTYTVTDLIDGEYLIHFMACGTYASGRSGGCIKTDEVFVEVKRQSDDPVTGVDGNEIRYSYDALGRLTFVIDGANGNRDYDYDAAGNRTSTTAGSASD